VFAQTGGTNDGGGSGGDSPGGDGGGSGGTQPTDPNEPSGSTEPGELSEEEAAAHSAPKRTPVYDSGDENVADDAPLDIPVPAARAEKQPLIMAHYQPWYQVPAETGRFNHWNLGTTGVGTSSDRTVTVTKTLKRRAAATGDTPFDLTETLPNGQANIGAANYPLTGPYDSRDSDTLEYQAALMKISGIDGLIFDWYGDKNFSDYGLINEGFVAMVKMLERAKLKFAVCYEDNTIGKMVEASAIAEENAVPTAREEMKWLNDN
jgi:hypothetical protein